MKVLLFQLDGKLPNIALMKISAHHSNDEVRLWEVHQPSGIDRALFLEQPDRVYASLIFEKTRWLAEVLLEKRPDAQIGGTGWDLTTTLEGAGIVTLLQDYSLYPKFQQSIGFANRGCRLKCPFCVVPRKEGKVRRETPATAIWRGDGYPRELLLLDNDFFGDEATWREDIEAIRTGGFKVAFTQGINARMLNAETAGALASIKCFDNKMERRRIYTAWDNRRDEETLFAGLRYLTEAGFHPDQIMVYMLIGWWKGETEDDWVYRHDKLRAFGAKPYPMPYHRTHDAIGFQRWVVKRYDKIISWPEFKAADYRPENCNLGWRPPLLGAEYQ